MTGISERLFDFDTCDSEKLMHSSAADFASAFRIIEETAAAIKKSKLPVGPMGVLVLDMAKARKPYFEIERSRFVFSFQFAEAETQLGVRRGYGAKYEQTKMAKALLFYAQERNMLRLIPVNPYDADGPYLVMFTKKALADLDSVISEKGVSKAFFVCPEIVKEMEAYEVKSKQEMSENFKGFVRCAEEINGSLLSDNQRKGLKNPAMVNRPETLHP